MHVIPRRAKVSGWLALVAVFVAASLSAMVPSNVMAARSPDGAGMSIVLCTGHGMVTLDSDGQPVDGEAEGGQPCPFAAAGQAALATPMSTGEPVVFPALTIHELPSSAVTPGRRLPAPPPPATGPPELLI